ncbi:hypothetical protein ACP70R_008370 [Stipagrostis hirtigluma subsp. patula]
MAPPELTKEEQLERRAKEAEERLAQAEEEVRQAGAERASLEQHMARAATAALHAQAVAMTNFRSLTPIVLELTSPHYHKWRGVFLNSVEKYALEDHDLSDVAVDDSNVAWWRMDATVLSWLYNTIASDLLEVIMDDEPIARSIWLALEQQFVGNKETRAAILDQEFQNCVQGDPSITDYCRRLKGFADALSDLDEPAIEF